MLEPVASDTLGMDVFSDSLTGTQIVAAPKVGWGVGVLRCARGRERAWGCFLVWGFTKGRTF